jgi:Response regulator containing a CheY-like receiver domain and an HTH DNA-binding domain
MALSPKQIQAAELLARGYSHQEVADAINTSRRTVLRWLKLQDFRDLSFGLVHRAPQPTPQQAPQRSPESRKLSNELTPQDLVGDALEAVRSILQDSDCRNCDRLKAAALVGEWTGLGVRGKMAEMEALKVLIEADWIDDAAINTLLKNWQILSLEMKDFLKGK